MMRGFGIKATAYCLVFLSTVTMANAQGRNLDEYLGVGINAAKGSLYEQGFRDAGHRTRHGRSWALMWNGRTCVALHGYRGVIDDVDVFHPRNCTY